MNGFSSFQDCLLRWLWCFSGELICVAFHHSRNHTLINFLSFRSQPGIYPTPFPYASQLHVPADTPVEKMTELSLSHLALLFKQQIPAHEVACIVIEPVLGEGGYVPAPKEWLQGLREVCDKEGIILGESPL